VDCLYQANETHICCWKIKHNDKKLSWYCRLVGVMLLQIYMLHASKKDSKFLSAQYAGIRGVMV
jgi:hypothetical protein